MRPCLLLSLAAIVSLGACAPTPAQTAAAAQAQQVAADRLQRELAGLTPDQPTSCIPLSRPDLQTKAYGSTLLYRQSRSLVYRNDTAGGCEGASRGDVLVSVEQEGRPCKGDIVRTVDPVSRTTTGSCALGDFVPYRKK